MTGAHLSAMAPMDPFRYSTGASASSEGIMLATCNHAPCFQDMHLLLCGPQSAGIFRSPEEEADLERTAVPILNKVTIILKALAPLRV